MPRLARYALAVGMFFVLGASAARADSVTYDFNYNGVSLFGSTANGTGSLTYTYTPGSNIATLTNFSFVDSITSGKVSSVFDYGIGDLDNVTMGVSKTGQLLLLDITTNYLYGSNTLFGSSDFTLNLNGYLDATTGTRFADDTFGIGSMALAATPTPEPSSLILLGTGLVGLFGVTRRKIFG